jgi:hypothetical protein
MTRRSAEAPEVGPETGYSSIGGMLPYWDLPQGGLIQHRPLSAGQYTRKSPHPELR